MCVCMYVGEMQGVIECQAKGCGHKSVRTDMCLDVSLNIDHLYVYMYIYTNPNNPDISHEYLYSFL